MWGADLADMQLINKSNKGFRFLLCVIDICSKYLIKIEDDSLRTTSFSESFLPWKFYVCAYLI